MQISEGHSAPDIATQDTREFKAVTRVVSSTGLGRGPEAISIPAPQPDTLPRRSRSSAPPAPQLLFPHRDEPETQILQAARVDDSHLPIEERGTMPLPVVRASNVGLRERARSWAMDKVVHHPAVTKVKDWMENTYVPAVLALQENRHVRRITENKYVHFFLAGLERGVNALKDGLRVAEIGTINLADRARALGVDATTRLQSSRLWNHGVYHATRLQAGVIHHSARLLNGTIDRLSGPATKAKETAAVLSAKRDALKDALGQGVNTTVTPAAVPTVNTL